MRFFFFFWQSRNPKSKYAKNKYYISDISLRPPNITHISRVIRPIGNSLRVTAEWDEWKVYFCLSTTNIKWVARFRSIDDFIMNLFSGIHSVFVLGISIEKCENNWMQLWNTNKTPYNKRQCKVYSVCSDIDYLRRWNQKI